MSSRPDAPGETATEVHARAMEGLDPAARAQAERAATRAPTTPDVEVAWKKLVAARAAYEHRRAQLDEREKLVGNRELALADDQERHQNRARTDREALETERVSIETEKRAQRRSREELSGERDALDARERALDAREREANARDAALIERAQIAEAGFIERDKTHLAALHDQLEALRAEADGKLTQLAAARAAFDAEMSERRDAADRELAERRTEALARTRAEAQAAREALEAELTRQRAGLDRALDARRQMVDAELDTARAAFEAERARLAEREAELRVAQQSLAIEQTLYGEDREALEREIERRCAVQIERLTREAHAERQRKETVEADRDRLFRALEDHRRLEREYGDDPGAVRAELDRLRVENDTQRQELAARPGRAAEERLVALEESLRQLRADHADLEARKAEVDAQLSRMRVEAGRVEQLRDEKDVLEVHRDTLRLALDELRREVADARDGEQHQNPFGECARMDADYADPIALDQRAVDLTRLAESVRYRIAHDPDSNIRLCYTAPDIRSFIGGLAMSRLHLLQGISGTGKTSLPRHFARAIGGATMSDAAVELIEVQAGWRDQLDLLGHYNAFQRRFYEGEFLKALYRAGTPAYADRPFFVVLDEMNLSRPEQYFATILSALERPRDAEITLMELRPGRHPQRFTHDGRKLPLPPNVWFIGTANHDESTVEFADKTYDRAHVMELPRQREGLDHDPRRSEPPREPISFAKLEAAFDAAVSLHGDAAVAALEALDGWAGPVLRDEFGVGWGNRLEKHIRRYVPVVVAAGGDIGEALDHVLATKVLRKVRDRYDTTAAALGRLDEAIESAWTDIGGSEPTRSRTLLDRERRRVHSGSSA